MRLLPPIPPRTALAAIGHFAMQLENEAHDLERIAKALISKEISYGCLVNVLLGVEDPAPTSDSRSRAQRSGCHGLH